MRKSLFSVGALALLSLTAANARAVDVGEKAPDFTLTDQSGKAVKLSDFAGKPVVLEWFNDGCPFVKKHYVNGDMNKVASKYAAKGVVWLAVNSTSAADQAHNAEVAKKWSMERPILNDSKGDVGHSYGATNTPHLYVIDGGGKLVYKGAIDSNSSSEPADVTGATNYVAAALDDVIAGKSVMKSETKAYGCTVKYAK